MLCKECNNNYFKGLILIKNLIKMFILKSYQIFILFVSLIHFNDIKPNIYNIC